MNMLSFYGGPAGKDFTITKVFPNKAEMDEDVALGNDSPIYAGDYVLISYGDPNLPTFAENLAADGDISQNATLWKKEWNNGYNYRKIVSIASNYPKFAAGSIEASLPFGSAPQLSIDSSSLANPKVGLKMPASLKAGTANTTESVAPTELPSVTPVYGGDTLGYGGDTLGNELSFKTKIPRGVTFTPSVSDAGEISWTNDGGLANPTTKSIKGQKGDTGVSFAGIEYTPSTASGGNNTFKVKYSNGITGTESYNIRNGIDITSVEEVSSDADGGINSITFVKSDGTKVGPMTVKNGSKGSTGTIKSVTATVDANVGTPQVTAKAEGDLSNADITFEFKNLKGNPGTISTVTAAVDNTSVDTGDPGCVVELGGPPENRSFNLVFSHLVGTQGAKGDTGYYFTPAVDALGNLSWNNNGELNNPATVNIKGPKGDGGTVEITSVVIDNGSSETATPSVEVISGTTDPQHAKYSLSFHNLVGKRGVQGPRGYYFLPSVSANGDLSWTNNSGGELANPTTVNIRGPQGKVGNPLNIIANEIITAAQVAEDTTATVGTELTARGWNPSSGELIGVTYEKTENEITSYWYFKISNEWQRVQLSGGIDSAIINEKVTDSTATDKVYSAAYVNALEARLKILEEALTIGKISEIGGR